MKETVTTPPFSATDGHVFTVDWTDYNLTRHSAATALMNGGDVIALPYADYSADKIWDIYPQQEQLRANDFSCKTHEDIMEELRYYEFFASKK